MAMGGKIELNPEHLLGGDGTVEMALRLWTSRNEPVNYNQWQSLYFQLVKQGCSDERKVTGESYAVTQKRIAEMYEVIQSEIHGPDFKSKATMAGVWRQEGSEEPKSRPDSPCVAGPVQSQLDLQAPDAVRDIVVRANEEAREFRTPEPTNFGDLDPDTPERFYMQNEAQRVYEDDEATHTECTEEQNDRLQEMAGRLSFIEGSDPAGIEFILRVDQLCAEYKEQYALYASQLDQPESLRFYAMEKLTEINPDEFEEEIDFKQHVYALGRLCGRTPAQGRMYSKSMWMKSKHSTPQAVDAGANANARQQRPTSVTKDTPKNLLMPVRREFAEASPGQASSVDVMKVMNDMGNKFC